MIDLGEGEAVAFKVESHNHPSAVEPFQGAATGVGGILRDIVAMGARPIALLDGLRFGEPGGSSAAPSPASATTATASASRPSAARPSSTRPTRTTVWSTRCASASSRRPVRRARATAIGAHVVLYGAHDGTRRHRRRVRARERRARGGRPGQAAVRPDRRPVHRQEADRGVARARRERPRRVPAGLRRRRARLLARGDGARRRRHRRPPRPGPAARGRAWSRGRS